MAPTGPKDGSKFFCFSKKLLLIISKLHISSDITRSGKALHAVGTYYKLTSLLARQLAVLFKVAFPEKYDQYRKAFEAGVWIQADPGPWLGRVIVYKLQVALHIDRNDDGPTACFPSGFFTGGALKVPQMNAKFW